MGVMGYTILFIIWVVLMIGLFIWKDARTKKRENLESVKKELKRKRYTDKEVEKRMAYVKDHYHTGSDGLISTPLLMHVLSKDFYKNNKKKDDIK